jgi:hypothetical protein
MKQIILLFFVFVLPLSAYCQVNNLGEGNQCFNQGDYNCAVAKYKEVFKTATGKDKQIADIKIQRAKRCIENLKNADLAFNGKNYSKAKEFYLAILDSNPQDEFVKGRLESINKFLSTPVQKPLNPTTKSPSNPIKLSLSKTEISFKSSGGSDYIDINLNSNLYTVEMLPSWCSVQKYNNYFVVICNVNKEISKRSDYFYVKNGVETIRVNVTQQTSSPGNDNLKVDDNKNTLSNNKEQVGNSKPPKKYKQKLYSFSSIGFQSGEIAKYGFIYEHGGKKTVGFRFSARTSLTSEQEILNGAATKNKTEIELGPNFRIFNRVYLNIGVGYGYYDRLMNNNYANILNIEKTGYLVATTGIMIRLSRVINLNGGASFMDIDKDFYNPEITFGISFNLKGKYKY